MQEQPIDPTIYVQAQRNILRMAEQLRLPKGSSTELNCPNKGPRMSFNTQVPLVTIGSFAEAGLQAEEINYINDRQEVLPGIIKNILTDKYFLGRQTILVPTLGNIYPMVGIRATNNYAPSETYLMSVLTEGITYTCDLPINIGTLEEAPGNRIVTRDFIANAPQDYYFLATPVKYGRVGEAIQTLREVTPRKKLPFNMFSQGLYTTAYGHSFVIHAKLIPVAVNPGDGSLPSSSIDLLKDLQL